MLDFEKEELEGTAETFSPCREEGDWEQITDAHATAEETSGRADARQSPEAMKTRIYRKIDIHHRERIGIDAVRYALLAIGLTAVAYLVRDMTGLAIGLGVVALGFGLTAAYGAGKYHEM